MNVAFWAASEDGSSHYRCDLPAAALAWRGHRPWSSTVLPASVARWSDVVVASRVVKPESTRQWEALRAAGRALMVFDLDDDYWHLRPGHDRAYRAWNAPGVLDRLTANLLLADRVTVASAGLVDVVRAVAEAHDDVVDVRHVPNGLHAAWLGAPRTYADGGTVRIGWAGTATTVTELHLAARALNRIVDYRPHRGGTVEVVFIGATPELLAGQGIATDHPRIRWVEWIDGHHAYLQALAGCDVVVAPYIADPFTEAKFPTKALECGMLGIPLVASAIRPYREWTGGRGHGEAGVFLVDQDQGHEWGRYLKLLVDDARVRAGVGQSARARASTHTMQELAPRWEEAIRP